VLRRIHHRREVLVAHRNARTTLYARHLIVARYQAGWPAARIAEQLRVSRATVYKWLARHRDEGDTGLTDRSCRPHTSPTRLPADREQEILGGALTAEQLAVLAPALGALRSDLERRRSGLPAG
jgi:transposase-like protein